MEDMKCPFRKIIIKHPCNMSNNIEMIEEFANCLKFNCMSYYYEKIGDIESIGCRMMGFKHIRKEGQE